MTRPKLTSTIALLALALGFAPAADAREKFLSGPSEADPLDVALGYVESHLGELGLGAGDVADLIVTDRNVSRQSGVTNIYLRQRLGGVEVVNGVLNVHVMPDGRILHVGNTFIPNLAGVANAIAPSISQEQAVGAAATHLGFDADAQAPVLLENIGGAALEVRFDGAGISRDDIPVRLMYLPEGSPRGSSVRLVWSLVVNQINTPDWWNLFVDAQTGEVARKFNWTIYDNAAAIKARTARPEEIAPRPEEIADGAGCPNNCYTVLELPKVSPLNGGRTTVQNPAEGSASPFAWHDTNGVAGAEFTDTRGNNVEAQTDLDANNVFTPGTDVRPSGGGNLIFDFPFDDSMAPETYQEAAVVNLFYFNNIMHDIAYGYGFDEESGNFQTNNYGNPGAAGDPVQADAQDGSGTNNANFGTPPDGADPRMQMFQWTPVENAQVTVNSPAGIADDYIANMGGWGGALSPATTADLELVDDGTATNQGCNALVGFTPGNIALIDRGGCEFGMKGLNAEQAGAVGAIIINDQQLPNGLINMGAGAVGNQVTIPTVMIGSADGTTIRNEEPAPGVNATITEFTNLEPNRDSDFDNGVIGHEYGHGISNRLVGGPANVGCLNGNEQPGEGWSDWWTLVLGALPDDTPEMPRGVGNYLTYRPLGGIGIRNFPYSTDLGVNPQTYADIGGTNIPHGVGEIWNAMAWEMYWLIVRNSGFDEDFYFGEGGNNVAIQLVVEAMKLTACPPTFVDTRDAILAADTALYDDAHECEIWVGFAKRGAGFSAIGGDPGVVGDETEAFDLPPGLTADCVDGFFADGFESGGTTLWD